MTYKIKKKEGWNDHFSVVRYHVRFEIDTATNAPVMTGKDDQRSWRHAPAGDRIINLEWTDLERHARNFAIEFYAIASA